MPPQFKLASFIMMWIVVAVILLTMIGTGFLATGGFFAWVLAFILAGGAANASSDIFKDSKNSGESSFSTLSKPEKRKRGGSENVAALLSLLDDDDAADLRERIKQHLIDRITTNAGDTDEMESFEELLSSRERQKRR